MPNAWPLPHGPAIAIEGLRQAVVRVHQAGEKAFVGGGSPVWIGLSEALFWVAALDDSVKRTVAGYFARRDRDVGGRTVGGLVFARNLHTHQLVTAGETAVEFGHLSIVITPPDQRLPPQGRGTLFSMQLRWIPLSDLRLSRGRRSPLRQLYAEHVGGRPLTHPFADAISWFERVIGGSSPR